MDLCDYSSFPSPFAAYDTHFRGLLQMAETYGEMNDQCPLTIFLASNDNRKMQSIRGIQHRTP